MKNLQPDLRRRLAVIFAAFALALALPAFRHPFYLSICEVDHNAQAKTLEISFKIFTDDLEDALAARGAEKLQLGTPQEARDAGRILFSYLRDNVAFIVEGDTAAFEYLGKEVEMEVTWCYVEAKGVRGFKKIEVLNRLLMERHEEQANIVHVRTGGVRKSLLLHKNQTRGTLEFP